MQIQQDMKEKSKHRCTKKECAGLDRLNPLKSFFLSVPDGIFPRCRSWSCPVFPVFSVPPRTQSRHPARTKTLQQPPFPWLLPQALGDSVKTGQREPMGLWVALLASVGDTVHTYRLLISRDKEARLVRYTSNSLPYAVGRDKETKAPSFWESGIKRGFGGDWRNGTQSKTKTQTIKKHRTMIIEYK